MSKSKAYSSIPVNQLLLERFLQGRDGLDLVLGADIGKFTLLLAPRWSNGEFARPWRVNNPDEIPHLIALLARLAVGRHLLVALEPSGSYGDALRQALHDAGVLTQRVSPKAAHDYAEIFDGTPSQHDGKDAAVIAELAALGKAEVWPYEARPLWEQELLYQVDWLEAQRGLLTLWSGRLEGVLARHWPEATRVLPLTSSALLRALIHYGSPQALAADPGATERLAGWGRRRLSAEKVQRLIESARSSQGVRPGVVEVKRLQEYAQQAAEALQQMAHSRRQLRRLLSGQAVLEAHSAVVGGATACVLWSCLGDPRDYPCGAAYRKAMGLNLTERSSGTSQGKLHISKRGNPRARRWLYLAAVRLVKRSGVKEWYHAKKGRDGQQGKRALVAVMRKLALALYQVGAHGAVFEAARLFPGKNVVRRATR